MQPRKLGVGATVIINSGSSLTNDPNFFWDASNSQLGIRTNTPDVSSILELNSTSSGFLLPRMTEAQRDAILNPANGLIVFQTDVAPGIYFNTGTAGSPNWEAGPTGTGPTGTQITLQASTNVFKGQACCFTPEISLAKADNVITKNVNGIVVVGASTGFEATIQTDGHITLSTIEWDAATGQVGGLNPGKIYYLSPSIAGGIEPGPPTATSGDYIAPLGTALTTTVFKLDTEPSTRIS